MRRATWLLAGLLAGAWLAALTGCSGQAARPSDLPEATAPAESGATAPIEAPAPAEPPSPVETSGASSPALPSAEEAGDTVPGLDDPAGQRLLAAAIVRAIRVDNSFGGHDAFDLVYVSTTLAGASVLGDEARRAITARVSPRATVRFVPAAQPVIDRLFPGGGSHAAGVVVYLERVVVEGSEATIDVGLWCAETCGTGTGYEARLVEGRWWIVRSIPRWIS